MHDGNWLFGNSGNRWLAVSVSTDRTTSLRLLRRLGTDTLTPALMRATRNVPVRLDMLPTFEPQSAEFSARALGRFPANPTSGSNSPKRSVITVEPQDRRHHYRSRKRPCRPEQDATGHGRRARAVRPRDGLRRRPCSRQSLLVVQG